MRSEVIRDWASFWSLKADWNILLSRSRSDTIFLTWEWIESWIQVVDKSIQPFVVAVRDEDETLVGLAPFYLAEFRLLKTVSYRTLRIMADYATGSEYPDIIAPKNIEAQVIRVIVKALAESRKHWDCIWMPNMAGWTGAIERILQACKGKGFYYQVRPRNFACFELPNDMEIYMRSLSRNRRSQLRRQMKTGMGNNGIKVSRCQTAEELAEFLDALFTLHSRRWESKGDVGSFSRQPAKAIFYRKFAAIAFDLGWLRLYALKENDDFKAVQIGYVYNHTYHQLQEGFDPEYIPGTGNVLRMKVIEACISEGVMVYDFLGEMTEHKRRWTAKVRKGYDLFIGRNSIKNRLLFTKQVWPTGRFLRPVNLPVVATIS